MSFLDGLSAARRRLMEDAARAIHLQPGEFLVRRGDSGDDLFLLDVGTLEVRDRRTLPETVLATIEAGHLVGEVSFADGAPRSADVLAVGHARVLRWHRDDVQAIIDDNPEIAAHLYRAMVARAVATIRSLSDTRVGEQVRHTDQAENDEVESWVERVTERFKRGIAPLETRLREAPDPDSLASEVHHHLEALQADVSALFEALDLEEAARTAEKRLRNELNPWLARSALADQALHREPGAASTLRVLTRIVQGTPSGEGRLGHLLDSWLLARPTFTAQRGVVGPMSEAIVSALPADWPGRVLFVSAGTGHLLRTVLGAALPGPTSVAVLGQTLAGADLGDLPEEVRLERLKEKVVDFATGRTDLDLWPRHVVVLHTILEYLPAPLVVALLEQCRGLLAEPHDGGGCVVAASLQDAPDDALLRHVLGWPLIRRTPEGLAELFRAAGFGPVDLLDIQAPACAVVARLPPSLATPARAE